jgi:hypothetical protein
VWRPHTDEGQKCGVADCFASPTLVNCVCNSSLCERACFSEYVASFTNVSDPAVSLCDQSAVDICMGRGLTARFTQSETLTSTVIVEKADPA